MEHFYQRVEGWFNYPDMFAHAVSQLPDDAHVVEIGTWKGQTDVYPRDYVVINGVKTKPPKYYDVLFERENPGVFSELVAQRELDGYVQQLAGEHSNARLAVKEQIQVARVLMLKRSL